MLKRDCAVRIGGEKTVLDRLIVCGGGHVGLEVGLLGVRLSFDVVVIDDREEYADPARIPGATMVCAPYVQALQDLGSRDSDYYVIVTRGHAFDAECLEQVLRGNYAYAGMMGSDRKVASVKARLLDKGFSEEQLDAVYAPIGLPIPCETPAEIAVSIAGQLIEVRSSRLKEGEQAVPPPPNEDGILCTIVQTDGSTPRRTGAWMLVTPNGKTTGTIGGGTLEAATIREALDLWVSGENKRRKEYVLDEKDVDLGMICGGNAVIELVRYPKQHNCPGRDGCDKDDCPFG